MEEHGVQIERLAKILIPVAVQRHWWADKGVDPMIGGVTVDSPRNQLPLEVHVSHQVVQGDDANGGVVGNLAGLVEGEGRMKSLGLRHLL